MNPDRALQVIAMLGSSGRISGEWLRASCPFAPWMHSGGTDRHPSFGVNLVRGNYTCWSCGQRGPDLVTLIYELRLAAKGSTHNLQLRDALRLLEGEELVTVHVEDWHEEPATQHTVLFRFAEEWLASFLLAATHPQALSYLENRRVTLAQCYRYDIRFDSTRGRICFPIRGFDGFLYGLHGRDVTGKSDLPYLAYGYKKKRNPSVWMNEHRVALDQPVVLCEGPFDLVSIDLVHQNVLAGLTASVGKKKLERIQDAIQIITFYDAGKAGDKGRLEVERFFKGASISHVIPPDEEHDAGDMSVDQIKALLQPHLSLTKLT